MPTMLERYKRTFIVTQFLIAAVVVAVFLKLHVWQAAAAVFVAMQLGAVTGSLWAARLKRRVERVQGLMALR
jgi:hypothetical protein